MHRPPLSLCGIRVKREVGGEGSEKRCWLRWVQVPEWPSVRCVGNIRDMWNADHLWTAVLLLVWCVVCWWKHSEEWDLRCKQRIGHWQPSLNYVYFTLRTLKSIWRISSKRRWLLGAVGYRMGYQGWDVSSSVGGKKISCMIVCRNPGE